MPFDKFLFPVLLLVLTMGFGFWLSRTGKPYNGLLFNVHKLIALGTVILLAVQFYRTFKSIDPQAILTGFIIFVVICAIILFVTGALMSIGRSSYIVLKTSHTIAPFLMAFALAGIIYQIAVLNF